MKKWPEWKEGYPPVGVVLRLSSTPELARKAYLRLCEGRVETGTEAAEYRHKFIDHKTLDTKDYPSGTVAFNTVTHSTGRAKFKA